MTRKYIMEINLRVLVALCLIVLQLVAPSLGAFETPTLAPMDPEPQGVQVITADNRVLVNEEIPESENEIVLRIAVLKVTGSEEVTISNTIPPPPPPPEGSNVDFFRVEKENDIWYLVLLQRLDHEKYNIPNPKFTIFLKQGASSSATILVEVKDVNDNGVQIVGNEPEISENYPELVDIPGGGQFLTKILCSDEDDVDVDKITWELEFLIGGDKDDPTFKIENTGDLSGDIFIIKKLNYSEYPMHRIRVWAYDSGEIHNDSFLITVDVKDLPNRPPEWTNFPTIITIDENIVKGAPVLSVKARDGDLGLNWKIEYSLVELHGNEIQPYFTMNKKSGEITVARDIIDAEELYYSSESNSLSIELEVTATEKVLEGEVAEKVTGQIVVNIRDLNDNVPEICSTPNPDPIGAADCSPEKQFTASIFEDAIGTIELQPALTVRDIDSTLPFAKYSTVFDEGTPQIIIDALEVQPSKESSGITTYSISIKNPSLLDYEGKDDFWWHEDDEGQKVPTPVSFKIRIVETESNRATATAEITLTVQDKNDNAPQFDGPWLDPDGQEYQFAVCENQKIGTILTEVIQSTNESERYICSSAQISDIELKISAVDSDISANYGSPSIRYRWYEGARKPPLDIDNTTGKMTVNNENNFDYERFTEEIFIVEAYDNAENENDQKVTNIPVKFTILDKNDKPVDLRLSTSRITVKEAEGAVGDVVFENGVEWYAIAEDVDLNADMEITLNIENVFVKDSNNLSGYKEIKKVNEEIQEWFTLEQYDGDNKNQKRARLLLGKTIPDREGYGNGDIDRVDLTITAIDKNTPSGEVNSVSQPLTVTIEDVNDTPPSWEDNLKDVSVTMMETEEFGPGGEDGSTDIQREIYIFRATDADRDSKFTFTFEPKDCVQEFCDEMKNLVELIPDPNDAIGRATFRRKQGEKIDREDQRFYGMDTDYLKYTVTVSDTIYSASVDITISIEDLNDNDPIWDDKYDAKEYVVNEDEMSPIVILKVQAQDKDKKDKFGKVNYRILDTDTTDDGFEEFEIDVNTGELKAKPGTYDWTKTKRYTVTVEAIDFYRPDSPSQSGSNRISVILIINVKDANTNKPEFISNSGRPLITIAENIPEPGIPFSDPLVVRDVDDPSTGNAQFTAEITKVVKKEVELDPMPFTVGKLLPGETANHKNITIVPTISFLDQWGTYDVTFKVTDQGEPPLSDVKTYQIEIVDVNDNSPEFIFPDDTTKILVLFDSIAGQRLYDHKGELVPPAHATDKDDPTTENGEVGYRVVQNDESNDGFDYFRIPNERNGIIILSKAFDDQNAKYYKLSIEAFDSGNPPKSKTIDTQVVVVPEANREPYFEDNVPLTKKMKENALGIEVEIIEAFDPDEDLGEEIPELEVIIYYHLVGGNTESFEVAINETTKKPVIRNKEDLDREELETHQVVVFVSNSNTPPTTVTPPDQVDPNNGAYLIVNIEVEDEYDTNPEFVRDGVISGGISTNNFQDEVVSSVSVVDLDLEDVVTFTISSVITPSDPSLPATGTSFGIRSSEEMINTADLILQFTPQPPMKGFFTFNITATDKGQLSTTAQCKIYIIKENNVVEFKFLNRRADILFKKDLLANILSEAFQYQCNIDRISDDGSNINSTIVKAHFVDITKNEPILAGYISEQQFDPEVFTKLTNNLAAIEVTLAQNGIGGPSTAPDNGDRMIIYVLVGGVVVLAVVLLVISATCYFNNRSLSRRVRALTATTFGSQMSGLNRTGATMELPNTNEFAIEGSNPIWATTGDEKKMPAFDTESIGSGGSVLIGVEDDEDFKNYKSTNNPLFSGNRSNNEGQGDLNEDDYMDDLYEDRNNNNNNNNRQNAFYESDDTSLQGGQDPLPFEDGGNNFIFGEGRGHVPDDLNEDEHPHNNYDMDEEDYTDIPLPPTTRRNPLMNLAYEDDD